MAREPSTPSEPELRIPAELRGISLEHLRLLLPDISVSAESAQPATHCHRVTFTVTLRPGLLFQPTEQPTGNRSVKVRVIDKISGVPTTVAEVLLLVPAAGGSTTASVEWPMPEDAEFTPDFSNEITIIADPDNAIIEWKVNNSVTVFGTCIE